MSEFDSDSIVSAAHRAAEIVTDYYATLDERRVAPDIEVATLDAAFAGTLVDEGTGIGPLLDAFETAILPACMGIPHPLYLGLVNSSPLPAAFLADYLVSAVNNNSGASQQSPAFTAAEAEVLRLFRSLIGFPPESDGLVLPGGSAATLQALQMAREAVLPAWRRDGPHGLGGAPLIYTSEAAHFSVARAAMTIGVGSGGVVSIPATGRGALDVDALAARLERDRAGGDLPIAVVATVGTTGTGAIDPLAEIAALCTRHGVWLHVDACYGGAICLVDDLRPSLAGIERADSVAIDAHKWFFVPITAAILLVRDPAHALAAFDTPAPYIPAQGGVDAYRRGLPTSRRCSGFVIWFALRAHGLGVVREAVERNIRLSRLIEDRLRERGFRAMDGGRLSIACARWEPEGRSPAQLDALQETLARRVAASGRAWFSTVRHAEETWLRFNMVNLHARRDHVESLVESLAQIVERV